MGDIGMKPELIATGKGEIMDNVETNFTETCHQPPKRASDGLLEAAIRQF
jgi:hypothetical protein